MIFTFYETPALTAPQLSVSLFGQYESPIIIDVSQYVLYK